MTSPRISVALCSYNASRYIDQQLDSIAAQTRPPDEVIICDDASSDDSVALAARFRDRVSFPVRLVRNPQNLGCARNFEQAIGLCQGEFVALSDCDDVWYPNKLQLLSDTLTSNPGAGYVFSDADLIDSEGLSTGTRLWQRADVRYVLPDGFLPQFQVPSLLRVALATGATMMIRSTLRDIAFPIPDRWIHDYWITLLATFTGRHGIAIPEPLTMYRLHSSQTLGVRPSLRKLLPALQHAPRDLWAEELKKFTAVRDRLHSCPNLLNQCKPHELELLEAKLLHLSHRASARSSSGLTRYRIVLAEARSGRYHQFSLAWESILRDLCF